MLCRLRSMVVGASRGATVDTVYHRENLLRKRPISPLLTGLRAVLYSATMSVQVYHANASETLPATPGSYVLVLRLEHPAWLTVGRMGCFSLVPGDYLYVGSARIRGGIAARVGRHLKPASEKRARWHIDHLTAIAPIVAILAEPHSRWERRECQWATRLASWEGVSRPIPRFGSSDCSCLAHLFRWPGTVHPEELSEALVG